MKKLFITFTAILLSMITMAQTPAGFTYQAAVRDVDGNVITEQEISMEIKILQGAANGTAIYTETHTANTSIHGIVNLTIGAGSSTDDFTAIDWSSGLYFIRTSIDVSGGTNYELLGTTQLLSVPYAMHAQSVENITETDPNFNEWDKSTGISITESQVSDMGTYLEMETDPVYNASLASDITGTDTAIWNNKLDSYTETDPVFNEWDKSTGISITESQVSDMGTYLEMETDPVFNEWDKSSGILITESQITDLGSYLETEVDGSVTNELEMPSDAQAGDMSYYDGSAWQKVAAPEEEGMVLTYCNGEPTWTVDGICSIEIGDIAYGGVVFYIYQEGDPGYVEGEQHGLVTTITYYTEEVPWGCEGVEISGADETDMGTGAQNTIDIEAGCTTEGTGADYCANIAEEGYNDWFLPSKDELYEMYLQKDIIDSVATANGYMGPIEKWYMSSSEADAEYCWAVHFEHNIISNTVGKSAPVKFRPVREF